MVTRTHDTMSPWASGAQEHYEAFLSRLGQKGVGIVTRHVELRQSDASQGFGRCWKRMAGMLAQLAPHAIETAGHQALKFHIPDGKYRQQVFALEDLGSGAIYVYLPDIVAAAIARKILRPGAADGHTYSVAGDAEMKIELQLVTSDGADVPGFCKPMLGWGRRALKATLSVNAPEKQVRVLEKLCELAAESWAGQAGAAVAAR